MIYPIEIYPARSRSERPFVAERSEISLVDLTLEQLVESDFHLGSRFNQFDKLNFSYVFARRFKFSVINLAYSLYNLKLATYFISVVVSRRGKVLFYDGGCEAMRHFVRFIGLTAKQYSVSQKWIAGLLTNFKEFYPAVFTGVSRHFCFPKFNFGGMQYIHRPPNVFCSLNIDKGSASFLENFRLGIPTAALVNSGDSVSGVTFPIFSNNTSPYTHMTFFSILRSAILNGYKCEIYKFYRRVLKRLLKVRYLRHYASRRIMGLQTSFQFRLLILRVFCDNDLFFWNFIKFVLFPLHPDVKLLQIPVFIGEKFSEFYDVHSFVRPSMLSFFVQYLFPFCKNYIPPEFISNFEIFEFKSQISHDNFAEFFFSVFTDEKKFYRFIFYIIDRVGESFFSEDFFSFVDMILSRFFPLIFFLFRAFLELDTTISSKVKLHFLRSLNLLNFAFFGNKIQSFLDSLSKVEASNVYFHVLHDRFAVLHYQRARLLPMSTHLFSRLLYFKLSHAPIFVGFNFCSFRNLTKIVSNFMAVQRTFSFLKFSKGCKRFMRRFLRSQKFFRFLLKNYRKTKSARDFYFDLNTARFVRLSKGFIRHNQHKPFFSSRYINVSYLNESSASTKKKSSSLANKKANLFTLAYFEEEYDDSRFPFNHEFFFLQIGYGMTYMTREYFRNKFLQNREAGISDSTVFEDGILLSAGKRTRCTIFFLFKLSSLGIFRKKL